MGTFSEFIKAKGVKEFGETMDLSEAYVRVMLSKNHISRSRWPDLLLAYPEVGLNDLIGMERASKPAE